MSRPTRDGVRIELERLCFAYRGDGEDGGALHELTLSVPAGRVTAVLGPSGAGKSTLLAIIAGLLAPDRGDVRFDGRPVTHLPPEKRGLGVVFQSYALFAHMTVEDNVAFGPTVRGLSRRAARHRVGELLERFEIDGLARRYPVQLSGGERQRVALARALAFAPRALLLDEPLAALDTRLRLALRAELAERLAESAVTTLYVTHDQEEAMALGDRVAVLRDGRLEQVDTPEALYRWPASPFVASFIGEANFLPVAWDPELGVLSGPLGTWSLDTETAARLEETATGPAGGPAGALRAGAASLGRTGGPARPPSRLMLRPEDLVPAPPEGAHVAGTVVSSTFLGGRRRLVVRARPLDRAGDGPGVGAEAGGRIELRVDLPGSQLVRAGEDLALRLDLRRAVLLPEGGPDGARGAPPYPGAAENDPSGDHEQMAVHQGRDSE